MQSIVTRITMALVIVVAFATLAHSASKKPILLVQGPTAEQQVVAAIAANALKRSGFKTTYVKLDDQAALTAIREGTAHVHVALTGSDPAPGLSNAVEKKELVLLGGLKGNAKDERLLKVVSSSMKRKWADAQKMLKRFVLKPAVTAKLAAEVAAGASPQTVAEDWMKANRKTWKPWIAASKNWMKP